MVGLAPTGRLVMGASPTYLKMLEDMADLHVRKAAGYSGDKDTWANFREAIEWGTTPLQGCLIRLGDKYRRVQNLVRNPANDQVGEPVKDTLQDLAAYALIAICLLEEEEAVENKAKARAAMLEAEAIRVAKEPMRALANVASGESVVYEDDGTTFKVEGTGATDPVIVKMAQDIADEQQEAVLITSAIATEDPLHVMCDIESCQCGFSG